MDVNFRDVLDTFEKCWRADSNFQEFRPEVLFQYEGVYNIKSGDVPQVVHAIEEFSSLLKTIFIAATVISVLSCFFATVFLATGSALILTTPFIVYFSYDTLSFAQEVQKIYTALDQFAAAKSLAQYASTGATTYIARSMWSRDLAEARKGLNDRLITNLMGWKF